MNKKKLAVLTALCVPLLALGDPMPRLSDWLQQHPDGPDAYPLGLVWQVPSEKSQQAALKRQVMKQLAALGSQSRPLRQWVSGLPVTGRVWVPNADLRWLQANPMKDPLLQPQDVVTVPARPRTVTVLNRNGSLCRVQQAAGLHAADYVRACGLLHGVDYAWVAQPDGAVSRVGVANWNKQQAGEIAPGAWIWAAPRHWPLDLSDRLISFVATQGPALDAESALPVPSKVSAWSSVFSPDSDLPITANDWGEAGLLQTPSARMRRAGDLSFTLSRVYPYTRGNVFYQPFSWLEAGFRYTIISNRLYGPVAFSGNQAYVDKSIDFKFHLLDETAYQPELALGFRDAVGTGLWSSEYVVASKRTGAFDWSLGMGWGYLAGRADVGNPLSRLFPSFNTRTDVVGSGGNFSLTSYFHGPAALFGGVQYQTPWKPLLLKLEYDGNNYRNEPFANLLPQSSPWNVGMVYRWTPSVDVTAGVERGNTAMLSVTLHTDLDKLFTPKMDDPPPVPVRDTRPTTAPDWQKTVNDIHQRTNWNITEIRQQDDQLALTVTNPNTMYWQENLDKAVAVLHRDAPADVNQFDVVYQQRGNDLAEHQVDRNAWVAQQTQYQPPSRQTPALLATDPPAAPSATGTALYQSDLPLFNPHVGLNVNYNMGGPNGFLFYQVAPTVTTDVNFTRHTWLQGGLQYDVQDNFGSWTYDGISTLPHVRTDVRQYMTTSRLTMPNLQLTHVGKIDDNQYWSVYGGDLEMMFAGVGGEYLYRPMDSRVAFGVNVNEVRQRDFDQKLGLLSYQVMTGHGTVYWDTGWNNLLAQVSVGRYLAGDVGATFDVSRVFENGVRIGAFFTKTNVSAQQFGEGSFDKGIYVSIPFDAFLTHSSDTLGTFDWKPLTRDGGAMLDRAVTLYGLTSVRDPRALRYQPAPPPDSEMTPENRKPDTLPTQDVPLPPEQAHPAMQQWTDSDSNQLQRALYAGGFRHISIKLDNHGRLLLGLSNPTVRPASVAVGRAVRIALAGAPHDLREVVVTFEDDEAPVERYDFFALDQLRGWLDGQTDDAELAPYVKVTAISPALRDTTVPLDNLADMTVHQPTMGQTFVPGDGVVHRVMTDMKNAAVVAGQTDWLSTASVGAGLVLGSTVLDNKAFNFANRHASSSWLRDFDAFGNALPWAESAGVALAALGSNDPVLSATGYASSEAVVTSYAGVLVLKKVIGRARPYTGLGSHNFSFLHGSSSNGTDGFPSGHAIVSWAAITPFAMQYDAPWLYGFAVLTDMSRVGSRKHWVSDTVAGSVLGYGIGKFFWEAGHMQDGPRLLVSPDNVSLAWTFR